MICANIQKIKQESGPFVTLVAISKTKPVESILEAYQCGQRDFGENKVQELLGKYEQLPRDIKWHLVGHLQTNKVKYIAPFVSLIHSVDSERLLDEIEKQAAKHNRTIAVLLQVYIASEETKFGLSEDELMELLNRIKSDPDRFRHVEIAGLMGMATNTENENTVRGEFRLLKELFERVKNRFDFPGFGVLSMGMSGDYRIAVEEGSSMIRVGSLIFGER